MRSLLLLPLLLTACARQDEPAAPPPEPPALTLARVLLDGASCAFSPAVNEASLLAVDQRRGRARGEARPGGGELIELNGTAAGDLLGGVQLEGSGLTIAVQPADLPGVPVGASGIRRAARLTAATPDGGSVEIEGVWSCSFGR